jgi:hypothetical protein
MNRCITENELGDRMMLGLPYSQGGGIGSSNLDTVSSPDISQSPDSFKYPNIAGCATNISTPPPSDYEAIPTQSRQDFNVDINKIKSKVTPDEIIAGMQYELKKQVFKRKDVAKQLVVQNLKKDPKFYSNLSMMMINEQGVKPEAIKNILTELKKTRNFLY